MRRRIATGFADSAMFGPSIAEFIPRSSYAADMRLAAFHALTLSESIGVHKKVAGLSFAIFRCGIVVGHLQLGEVSRKHVAIPAFTRRMSDHLHPGRFEIPKEKIMRQRIMGLCSGLEDSRDGEQLRRDGVHQLDRRRRYASSRYGYRGQQRATSNCPGPL